MKKVSVVVPCYNAAVYLDKCVQSLLNQTIGIENMEIILVNDASTDDNATWNIMLKYEQQYPDTIMVISLEENMRQGGARNVGVSYASGEYLIFCDADDWLMEEALGHIYQAAIQQEADVVEFRIKNIRNREERVILEKGNRNQLVIVDEEDKRKAFLLFCTEEFSFGSQKKMYRLSLIQKQQIKFAEHLICEEPSFMVPVRCYETRHYFLDEALYVCYLSPGSTVRSNWGEHKWDNPKTWIVLMDDLKERGLLQQYYDELAYLFYKWGMVLTLRMLVQRGYWIEKEELQFLVHMVLERFPDIRNNQYILGEVRSSEWEKILFMLLDIVINDESIQVVNDLLQKAYVKRKERDDTAD